MNTGWPPTPIGEGTGRKEHGLWWEALVFMIGSHVSCFSLGQVGSRRWYAP